MSIDTEALLNSMAGIAYLTDARGTIIDLGRHNWNAFARANGAPELIDGSSVIGHSILDFVAGDEVRDSYRRCFEAIGGERVDHIRLLSRCDSPGVKRKLWLTVRPVHRGASLQGMLVQILVVSEELRPPIDLFDFVALRAAAALDPHRPILGMCSYCQNVRFPAGSVDGDGEWMSAEGYYHRGGNAKVRISHTLCPTCFDLDQELLPH
ncbi:MAG TPA: hypothetical protein VES39_11855 [Rhodospirillales bacterium]|nr:hypothetical protein [Rhodospirillales bacterium]